MPTLTITYQMQKPVPGGDSDVWGAFLNVNLDALDVWFTNTFDTPDNNPATGNLGTIKSTRIPSTIVGARTIQASTAPVGVLERTGSDNSVLELKGNAKTGYFGRSGDTFIFSNVAALSSPVMTIDKVTGNITWSGSATGNGSGITNLNGSNVATGTVPDARLPATMTGKAFTTAITFGSSVAVATDSLARHIDLFGGTYGFNATAARLNVVLPSGASMRMVVNGVDSGYWSGGGINLAGLATGFVGPGALITDLNASQLTTGTVPNGRMNGAYSFTSLSLSSTLSATGTITSSTHIGSGGILYCTGPYVRAPSDIGNPVFVFEGDTTHGLGRSSANAISTYISGTEYLRVTATAVSALNGIYFNGPGNGLTALNGNNIASGTVDSARLPTDAAEKNRILDRLSESGVGALGTYALLRNDTAPVIAPGGTTAGSNLSYAHTGGTIGTSPGGTWRAMGAGDSSRITLWLRAA